MNRHRIFDTSFGSVYPLYITKAERKGHSREEVDELINWLTGYSEGQLHDLVQTNTTFDEFFAQAPGLNENRRKITGVICGMRVEEIEDPLMREIRYLDKIIDELARGKKIDSIKRA